MKLSEHVKKALLNLFYEAEKAWKIEPDLKEDMCKMLGEVIEEFSVMHNMLCVEVEDETLQHDLDALDALLKAEEEKEEEEEEEGINLEM